jgi:hypothetical protein
MHGLILAVSAVDANDCFQTIRFLRAHFVTCLLREFCTGVHIETCPLASIRDEDLVEIFESAATTFVPHLLESCHRLRFFRNSQFVRLQV